MLIRIHGCKSCLSRQSSPFPPQSKVPVALQCCVGISASKQSLGASQDWAVPLVGMWQSGIAGTATAAPAQLNPGAPRALQRRLSPAWHPLLMPMANWDLLSQLTWSQLSALHTPQRPLALQVSSTPSPLHRSTNECEGGRGEKVLCCVDYCVFVIWSGISCRYSISQR